MEKWEVVRQDSGWFTIFKGQEQYCDDYGDPMRYECYWKAKGVCDELNDEMKQQETKEEKMGKVVYIVWQEDERVEKNLCQAFDNKEKAEQYAKIKKECDENGFDYTITEESFLTDSDMADELFQDMVDSADDIDEVEMDKISNTLEKITGNKWMVVDLPESENNSIESAVETVLNAVEGKTVLKSLMSTVIGKCDGGAVVAIEYK